MIAPGARTQHAAFEFIQGLDLYKTQKPFYVICGDADKLPEGEHTSLKTEWHDVNVRDVRGYENNLSFDAGGFKLFKYDTPIGTRFDDEDVKTDLKEMAEMMRVDVGAERAICYNFRIRSNGPIAVDCELLPKDGSTPVKPVRIVHTDHTREGGMGRIAKHLTVEEREKCLTGNYFCVIFK